MISTKLKNADQSHLSKGFELGASCLDNGISFYVVTASGSDEIKAYNNNLKICIADETTLKTIVRANPGYLLLKDGTIAGKWSWATVPPGEKFTGNMPADQVDKMNNKSTGSGRLLSILSAILLLLLISSLFVRNKDGMKADICKIVLELIPPSQPSPHRGKEHQTGAFPPCEGKRGKASHVKKMSIDLLENEHRLQ